MYVGKEYTRKEAIDMQKLTPESSVKCISGVGDTKAEQLKKLGITTVRDLIYRFPRCYEERGNIKELKNAMPEVSTAFLLTVASEVKSVLLRKGLTVSKFRAFDGSGTVEIVFFNSPYVKEVFHTGSAFRFWGKLSVSKKGLSITNPKYEPYIEGLALPNFVPVYSLTDGITSKFLDKITKTAFDAVINYIDDPLPEKTRLENSLCTLSYALKNIHFPESRDELCRAMRRLAFDELLCFGLGISALSHRKVEREGVHFSPCDITPLLNRLPYELTASQKSTVNDIYKDTVIPKENGKISPMARIIVGDVGSGKTVCAMIAAYIAAKSSYQTALMAPTEILARQHYKDFVDLLLPLGIKTELLLGSTTQKEKKRIYAAIESGECQIIIGTHALLSDKVNFSSLGLIITDEQHRFGVNQRAVLKEKTQIAHMLVMSATPIPRTLALTVYGDLDVSRITEMPKGRQRVDTFVVNEDMRARLNGFIEKQVSIGGQCYVVCPAIEEREDETDAFFADTISLDDGFGAQKTKLKNSLNHAEYLRQNLVGTSVECLHGKMKAKEKSEIMSRFLSGETKVLVSTTVIEVGVNVPNASLMIVENAERFGLSQLHQLRGRVGRGSRKSYCVLVSDTNSEKSAERLEIMRTTYDGYSIAEKDLLMRGPGDFIASAAQNDNLRQSGGFEFKMAARCDYTELLNLAFATAKSIINDDPYLTKPENAGLRKATEGYMSVDFSTIS